MALLLAALPTARLEYRAPGLESRCPSSEQVAERVSARLGHVPFEAGAPRQIRVAVERVATGFAAHVEVEARGQKTTSRDLTSPSCEELGDSIALLIALVLDPLSAPPESPAPQPVVVAPVESRPAPPPVPRRWSALLWAGPVLAVGASPNLAVGGRLGGALELDGQLAFGLEGRLQGSPAAADRKSVV